MKEIQLKLSKPIFFILIFFLKSVNSFEKTKMNFNNDFYQFLTILFIYYYITKIFFSGGKISSINLENI